MTEFEWRSLRFRATAWNLATKTKIHILDKERIVGVNESSEQLSTASEDGTVVVRMLSDFSVMRSFETQLQHVKCGEVSPLGHIAAGDRQGAIWLWNGDGSGNQLRAEGIPLVPVRDVAFLPDGSNLIAAYDDGSIRIWDVNSGDLLKTLQTGASEAWSLDVSPDGNSFVVGLSNGSVSVYDLKCLEMGFGRHSLRSYSIHRGGFSSDGTHVVIPGAQSDKAEIVRVHDGETIRTISVALNDSSEKIIDCLLVHSRNEIVLTTTLGRVYVANSDASDAVLRIDTGLSREIHRPAISPDGNWIAICCSHRAAEDIEPPGTIWNFRTGSKAFDLPRLADELHFYPHGIATFSLGTTGRILSIQGRTAAVWPADTLERAFSGEPERIVTLPRWLGAADLDGRGTVFLSTEDEGLFLWNTTTEGSRPRLLSRRLPLTSLAVSPDRKTLATGSVEGDLLLWSLPSGEPLFPLPGAFGPISHLQFTPDGSELNAIADTPRQTGEILHWRLGK